ncbi:uncharacterized protein K452DRAFT_197045, partial [Aplosporella prunicola CBS 121167]
PSSYAKTFPLVAKRSYKPPSNEREIASAFYQLKLGHGYFKSYLHRFNHTTTDKYRYSGTAIQTPEHLLLKYPLFRPQRAHLKDTLRQNNPNFKDLFSETKNITATVQFLKSTKVTTR